MQASEPTSSPRAVLWDMDGTLIDSGDNHWVTWRDALAAENFDLTREQFTATFGQRNDTILRVFFGQDLPMSEVERIGGAKEERYREIVRAGHIKLFPGVREWLARLHASGWRQAIASSAPLLNIEALLETLDIAPYFEAITSAEDVERGKPDPQVFLIAARKLGVPPDRSIVVEDAPAGIEGARRAGMCSIGVLTTQRSLAADLVVDRLDRLPPDAFEKLLMRD